MIKRLFFLLSLLSGSALAYTVNANTYLTDGSQADVQAACAAVPDNGTMTVQIPNGTYSWTGSLSITNSLTLAGASASGVTIQNNNAASDLIDVTSSSKGHTNIYWLNFVQVANNSGGQGYSINISRSDSVHTVLVHDCTFNNAIDNIFDYEVNVQQNGVIFWNDTFVGNGQNAEGYTGGSITGINFVALGYGYTSSWNTPDTMGAADTTGLNNSYVENCTFYDATDSSSNADDSSRVVFRYNIFQDAMIMTHGQDTSIVGVRHWEVYNNRFIFNSSGTGPSGCTYPINMQDWMTVRGGTGVVTGNSMDGIPYKCGVQLNVYSINAGFNDGDYATACSIQYPAPHQTGWGWSTSSTAYFGQVDDATNPQRLVGGKSPGAFAPDGNGAALDPLYVWNNTGGETTDPSYVIANQYTPDNCGNGQVITTYLQQNRDYYVDVAKPGWSPYPYPHPLHAQFAIGGYVMWEQSLFSWMGSIKVHQLRLMKIEKWVTSNTPAAPYSSWESSLDSYMSSIHVDKARMNLINKWIVANPPTRQGSP
jgi:hypothetical protein